MHRFGFRRAIGVILFKPEVLGSKKGLIKKSMSPNQKVISLPIKTFPEIKDLQEPAHTRTEARYCEKREHIC